MSRARAIVGVTGAAVAAGIGAGVRFDTFGPVNRAVRRRVRPRRSPVLTSFAEGISYLAAPHGHPFTAALLGALIRIRKGDGGIAPLAASIATLATDNATRVFVHQRRPPKAGRHHGRNRYGYPSGHVTAITSIAVACAIELADDLSPRERDLVWTGVVLLAGAVGWSRLYLDQHWIDDVVGGWAAGAAIGVGACSLSSLVR